MNKILPLTRKLIVFAILVAIPTGYFLINELQGRLVLSALLILLLLGFALIVKRSNSKEKRKLTRPLAGYISTKAKVILVSKFGKNMHALTFSFDYQGKTIETRVIIEGYRKQIETYLRKGNNAKIFVNPDNPVQIVIPQLSFKNKSKKSEESLFWRLFEGFFKYILPVGIAAAIIIPLYFSLKDNLNDVFNRGKKAPDFRFESLCYFKGNTETVWELYSDEASKYKLIVKNPMTNKVYKEIEQKHDVFPEYLHVFASNNKIWVVGAEKGKKPIIDAYNPNSLTREICDTIFTKMFPQIEGKITDSYYPNFLRYYVNGRISGNLVSKDDYRVLSFKTTHDKTFFYVFETGTLFDNEDDLYWYLCLDKYNHLNPSNYYYLYYSEKPEDAQLYKSKRNFARDNTAPVDINEEGYNNNLFRSGDFQLVANLSFSMASIVYADKDLVCIKHRNNKKKYIISIYNENKLVSDIDMSKCRNYYYLVEPEQVLTIRKGDTLLFRSKYLGTISFDLQSKKTDYIPDELYKNAQRKRIFSTKYDLEHENNELYVTETGFIPIKSSRLLSETRLKNAGIAYQDDNIALVYFKTISNDALVYHIIGVDYKGNILYTLDENDILQLNGFSLSQNDYFEEHLITLKTGNDLVLVFNEVGVIRINAKTGKTVYKYNQTN